MNLFRRGAGWRVPGTAVSPGCSRLRHTVWAAAAAILLLAGCASPGPPRPPSLHLPEPVRDLTARRVGDTVELQFTAPSRSSDKLPLRATSVKGVLCRAVDHQPCIAVAGFGERNAIATTGPNGGRNVVTWSDRLPAELASGPWRLLSYRVEFFNEKGSSAGKSEPAYTAAGVAPATVDDLRAEGSRLGIVLRWQARPQEQGMVLLRREDLAPAAAPAPVAKVAPGPAQRKRSSRARGAGGPQPARSAKGATSNVAWLESSAAAPAAQSGSPLPPAAETLDTSAEPNVPYRYTAFRSVTATLGGRSIEVRSAASAPVAFTLREIYPPPAPTGLTAVGYAPNPAPSAGEAAGAPSGFAVDLIWQPVDGAGLITPLAGYNVYREALGSQGGGKGQRLNTQPVTVSAFHDATANPATAYRYSVTAVDIQGNESDATTTVLQPSQNQ